MFFPSHSRNTRVTRILSRFDSGAPSSLISLNITVITVVCHTEDEEQDFQLVVKMTFLEYVPDRLDTNHAMNKCFQTFSLIVNVSESRPQFTLTTF